MHFVSSMIRGEDVSTSIEVESRYHPNEIDPLAWKVSLLFEKNNGSSVRILLFFATSFYNSRKAFRLSEGEKHLSRTFYRAGVIEGRSNEAKALIKIKRKGKRKKNQLGGKTERRNERSLINVIFHEFQT